MITLIPRTERGIFLERTNAECRKRLWLRKVHIESWMRIHFKSKGKKKWQKKRWRTNGITIAPRSEIARPVAPLPFSCGTKRPFTTSLASGFAYPSSAQKHAAIVNTRKAIKNSSFLTWSTTKQRWLILLFMTRKKPLHNIKP